MALLEAQGLRARYGEIEALHRSQRVVVANQIVERVREVLLIELARLRRGALTGAVRAEVGAVAVRPVAIEAPIRELCIVRPKVHAKGESASSVILRVARSEHAVHDLLPDD